MGTHLRGNGLNVGYIFGDDRHIVERYVAGHIVPNPQRLYVICNSMEYKIKLDTIYNR